MSEIRKRGKWRTGAFTLLLLGAAYLVWGFFQPGVVYRVVRVTDAGQSVDLELIHRDMYQPTPVTGLTIWVVGQIDGEGEFWIGDSRVLQVDGYVDKRKAIDWSDWTCTLHYQPVTAKSGELQVRHRFTRD